MKFTMEFDTDTAAFEDYGLVFEVSEIFDSIIDALDDSDSPQGGRVMDTNGNTIGTWSVK